MDSLLLEAAHPTLLLESPPVGAVAIGKRVVFHGEHDQYGRVIGEQEYSELQGVPTKPAWIVQWDGDMESVVPKYLSLSIFHAVEEVTADKTARC